MGILIGILVFLLVLYYVIMIGVTFISIDCRELEGMFLTKNNFIKSWIPFYGLKLLFIKIKYVVNEQFDKEGV